MAERQRGQRRGGWWRRRRDERDNDEETGRGTSPWLDINEEVVVIKASYLLYSFSVGLSNIRFLSMQPRTVMSRREQRWQPWRGRRRRGLWWGGEGCQQLRRRYDERKGRDEEERVDNSLGGDIQRRWRRGLWWGGEGWQQLRRRWVPMVTKTFFWLVFILLLYIFQFIFQFKHKFILFLYIFQLFRSTKLKVKVEIMSKD